MTERTFKTQPLGKDPKGQPRKRTKTPTNQSPAVKTEPLVRYSDTELAEFKEIITNKLKSAKEEYEEMKNFKNSGNGTGDTHQEPGDIADKTGERGGCDMVNEKILEKKCKFITSLEAALLRVDNKSYGICRESGRLIPKERLILVPHATLCVDTKEKQSPHPFKRRM